MPVHAKFSPTSGRLFFALLWNSQKLSIDDFKRTCTDRWGEISDVFTPSYFPMANYYQKEMGEPLSRLFLVLDGPFERKQLLEAKLWAMEVERRHLDVQGRMINIDPGLLCLEQALLISTKPYSHRIYIDDNLYVELLYTFEKGSYHPLPWSYPDYCRTEVLNVFKQWRKKINSEN